MHNIVSLPRDFRLIEVGRAVELSVHRNAVGAFYLALDGEMQVSISRGASVTASRCRSAFVPASVQRAVRLQAEAFACLFFHPCDNTSPLTAPMAAGGEGVFTDHPAEAEIAERLQAACRAARSGSCIGEGLCETLGIPAIARDGRIPRTIAEVFKDPGASNRVPSLANAAAISESRLRHEFKATTGLSIKRFRVWARLIAAMEEAERGESLTNAAHFAGFSSSAHFSTAHRAVFGAAPTDFLKAGRRRVRC